jgi:hypothetical protein
VHVREPGRLDAADLTAAAPGPSLPITPASSPHHGPRPAHRPAHGHPDRRQADYLFSELPIERSAGSRSGSARTSPIPLVAVRPLLAGFTDEQQARPPGPGPPRRARLAAEGRHGPGRGALLGSEDGQVETLWVGLQVHQPRRPAPTRGASTRQLKREAAAEARRAKAEGRAPDPPRVQGDPDLRDRLRHGRAPGGRRPKRRARGDAGGDPERPVPWDLIFRRLARAARSTRTTPAPHVLPGPGPPRRVRPRRPPPGQRAGALAGRHRGRHPPALRGGLTGVQPRQALRRVRGEDGPFDAALKASEQHTRATAAKIGALGTFKLGGRCRRRQAAARWDAHRGRSRRQRRREGGRPALSRRPGRTPTGCSSSSPAASRGPWTSTRRCRRPTPSSASRPGR